MIVPGIMVYSSFLMLANFHVRYYVFVQSSFKHRCLIFNLSGPCKLLFFTVLYPLGPEK